jgi:CRP-like cAMP-binding protein
MTATLPAHTKSTNFFERISPYVRLSRESKKALLKILVRNEWPKGTVIVRFDAICDHVYYIEKGLARSFYLKDGKEVTEKFSPENSFACSRVSYITKKSDNRQIELIEPSVVWTIPYVKLETLFDAYHDLERLDRFLVGMDLMDMHQRLNDLQFATAQERYQSFIDSNHSLLQRVSLGMIASYLGITQETLSRIRAQV